MFPVGAPDPHLASRDWLSNLVVAAVLPPQREGGVQHPGGDHEGGERSQEADGEQTADVRHDGKLRAM